MKWFDNWKLSSKLGILIVITAVFLLIVGYVGYSRVVQLEKVLDDMYHNQLLAVEYTESMQTELRATEAIIYTLIFADLTPERRQELLAEKDRRAKVYSTHTENYKKCEMDEHSRDLFSKIEQTVPLYREAREKALMIAEQAGGDAAHAYFEQNAKPLLEELGSYIEALANYNSEQAEIAEQQATAAAASATRLILVMAAIALIASILMGFVISRRISHAVGITANHATILSAGDFSTDIPNEYVERNDEIGALATAFEN